MYVKEKTVRAQLCSWKELTCKERELVNAALAVRHSAQAPYSHYHVGTALLASTGRVYAGCNVERASFSQTTHAEQSAVDQMVACDGAGTKILAMATVADPAERDVIIPEMPLPGADIDWAGICPSCGHCLQIIWENCLGDPDVVLIQPFTNGLIVRTTIGDAFPMRFGPSELGINLTE